MVDLAADQTEAVVRAVEGVAGRADRLLEAAARCASAIRGGGVLVVGAGPQRHAHADHVAVEFVHPVVAGRRSVPALVADGAIAGPAAHLWLGPGPLPAWVPRAGAVDLSALVETTDPVHVDVALVLVHHLLWELTHVLLDDHGPEGYLAGLLRSSDRPVGADDVVAKVERSAQTIRASLTRHTALLTDVAHRVRRGRLRIWTFGQGGSAADAALAARRLGGSCLSSNPAVLTALVNDLGPDEMYVRQVDAHVGSEDLVIALTTSGASSAVLRGLAAARRAGARTLALTGHAGLVGPADEDSSSATDVLAVDSDSIHRIQEAHLAAVGVVAGLASAR